MVNGLMNKKGLTLVETLVSIVLLAVFAGSMIGAFMAARVNIINARHRTIAMNLLKADMDWVMGQDYSVIEAWVISPRADDSVFSGELGADELIDPTRSTTIAKDPTTGILTVTITLNWTKRGWGGLITKGTSANPDERLVTLISP